MKSKRNIEIFSAGCSICDETINLVKQIACSDCTVNVLDMQDSGIANRAKSLGIQSIPAVVIDGQLAACCTGRSVDETTLRAAGLGQPVS